MKINSDKTQANCRENHQDTLGISPESWGSILMGTHGQKITLMSWDHGKLSWVKMPWAGSKKLACHTLSSGNIIYIYIYTYKYIYIYTYLVIFMFSATSRNLGYEF